MSEDSETIKDDEGNVYVRFMCVNCGAQVGLLQAGPQEGGGFLDPKKEAHCTVCPFCAPEKCLDANGEPDLECIEAKAWIKALEN